MASIPLVSVRSVLTVPRNSIRLITSPPLMRPLTTAARRHTSSSASSSSPPLLQPPPDGTVVYSDKLHSIVDEISNLTLREVSQLNELLKTTLNIPDAPVMTPGMFAAGGLPQQGSEEAGPKEEEQTEFTVNLIKFDEGSKVKLIKEIKVLMEGMNLVQAKKFVESLPQVVRKDIPKEEAEKLKAALEAAGGEVTLD